MHSSASVSGALCAALVISAELVGSASALSTPSNGAVKGHSIPLRRRPQPRTDADILAQARRQADALKAKYGKHKKGNKRANTGSVPLTDQNVDFQYYGSVEVGTPAKSYDVILDTGSSDLWLAGKDCQTGCEDVTNPFDPSGSSSFKASTTPIDIKYGSGEVAGVLGNDTVTMQGFTIQNQGFGVMDTLSARVLQGSLSGLMGLAWPTLAQSEAIPWWLAAINGGQWQDPLFGFYLERHVDESDAQTVEKQGGSMDLGFANTAYYTGDINYVPLSDENYWLIPLEGVTINGKDLNPGGGAAIDTGTSLIGGPTDAMANLYAQIPGAEMGTGQLEGYYTYPCSTNVKVSLKFGGKSYDIQSIDFSRPADTAGKICFGSFFGLDLGAGNPVSWIVGDSFLKNVYSVYRSKPAAVGFAAVNSNAGNGGGGGGGGGTTTQGGKSSSTGTSRPTGTSSGAAMRGAQVAIGGGSIASFVLLGVAALFGGALVL